MTWSAPNRRPGPRPRRRQCIVDHLDGENAPAVHNWTHCARPAVYSILAQTWSANIHRRQAQLHQARREGAAGRSSTCPRPNHRRGRHRNFAIGHGRTPRRHGIALISLPRLALRPMKKGRLVSQAPRTSPNGNCSSILPIRSRRIGTRIRARWLPGVNHNLLLHVPVVAMQLHS